MHEYNPALTTDDWLQYKPLHIRAIQIRICDLPAYLLTLELLTSHFYFSLNINANSPGLSRSLQATEKISWSLSSIYHHFLSYNFIFPFPAVRLEVKNWRVLLDFWDGRSIWSWRNQFLGSEDGVELIWWHICRLSQIIQESPGYRANLLLSCTSDQNSQIKGSLH